MSTRSRELHLLASDFIMLRSAQNKFTQYPLPFLVLQFFH
jgi:hypothetical protein